MRAAEKSEPEGAIKKYRMNMQSAPPRMRVMGFVFFRRTGPNGRAMGSSGLAQGNERIENRNTSLVVLDITSVASLGA